MDKLGKDTKVNSVVTFSAYQDKNFIIVAGEALWQE